MLAVTGRIYGRLPSVPPPDLCPPESPDLCPWAGWKRPPDTAISVTADEVWSGPGRQHCVRYIYGVMADVPCCLCST